MAAEVGIFENNGAGQATTEKTSGTIRFKNADNATVDSNNPLVKPGAGSDFSYEKWLQLRTKSAGPAGQITNVGCYSDGANNFGTGVTLQAVAKASYATPSETERVDDTNFFTYTSGSPLSLGAGPFTPGATTAFANFVVLQMAIDSTVSAPQTLPLESITFSWTET